jgi:S1-C subfamily serine protease
MRRSKLTVPVICAALVAPGVASSEEPGLRSRAALAFIRVFGDVRVDFANPLRSAIGEEDVMVASGSGFVITASGLILTNDHVVSGETVTTRIAGELARVTTTVKRLEVVVGAGESRETFAPVVAAADAQLDLAALQVTAADLAYIPFGDSDAAEAGRPITVWGFPFGEKIEVGKKSRSDVVPDATVTVGSLSAARRDEGGDIRYLQTDASINPGSSGGPMVDEDGYAVGVVRMKLAASRGESGAGFGVPINLVKDFLDAHGLLSLLPATRLRPGAVLASDWKGLHVEIADGFADSSLTRLRVDAGSVADISARVDRVASPWTVAELEEAALQGKAFAGFVPAPAAPVRQLDRGAPPRRVGSARGTTRDGGPFRLEYAILEIKGEKVVARFLGPPDEIAFNLGVVRRALETLKAEPLLTSEVRAPLRATLETAAYAEAGTGTVPLPAGWSREPARHSACAQLPAASAGLAASPPGDFTVVFRALRWARAPATPEAMARTCGPAAGATGASYSRRFQRLGVAIGAWGVFASQGEEVVALEAEAPEAKLAFVRDAFAAWVRGSQGP